MELVSTQISGVRPNVDIGDQVDVEVSASTLESDLGIGCGFFLLWPLSSVY